MSFVTAMEHRGVLGEGFQSVAFPAARDKARFLGAHEGLIALRAKVLNGLPSIDRDWEVERG